MCSIKYMHLISILGRMSKANEAFHPFLFEIGEAEELEDVVSYFPVLGVDCRNMFI